MTNKRWPILIGGFAALILVGIVCGFSARPLFFRILKGPPGELSTTIVNGLDTSICEIYLRKRGVELEPHGFNIIKDSNPLEPGESIFVEGINEYEYSVSTIGCEDSEERLVGGYFIVDPDNNEWVILSARDRFNQSE